MPNVAKFLSMVGTGVINKTKVTTVLVEGLPIATLGDGISTHGEAPHIEPTIILGTSLTVTAEGQPVAMVGSKASCMHSVNMGSFTVSVGL